MLTPRQREIILESRHIVDRIVAADGDVSVITKEEAETLLDMMSIMEEHDTKEDAGRLVRILDKHLRDKDDDS